MEVELQNAAFKYFMDVLAAIILEAKRNGRWDLGILGKTSRDQISISNREKVLYHLRSVIPILLLLNNIKLT